MEKFLTSEELERKTDEWMAAAGADSAAPMRISVPALIVVDMQKDYLLEDGLLPIWGGPAIIPNVCALVDAFHRAEQPVIFTRHIYENPERDGGATARWWNVDRDSMLLREGTWHAELHGTIRPGPLDRVIAKRRYSAFYGTDLELLLRNWGVKDVLVTGVCTNIHCQATVHDAFFRDFNVFMAADATGATDEEAQVATLQNLSMAYGKPVSAVQVIHALEEIRPWNRPGFSPTGLGVR